MEPLGDSVELAHGYGGLSTIYLLATELDEALAWGERALVLGERLSAEDVIVHALNNIGTALSYTPARARPRVGSREFAPRGGG